MHSPNASISAEQMNFAQPKHTVQQVNAAGKLLAHAIEDDWSNWEAENWTKWQTAVEVINNWRGSHAYPLNTFSVNLRDLARRLTPEPLLAQRIKRLQSIGLKLILQPSMKLSQMQDLGGFRAILSDVASVNKIADYYETKSNIKHARLPTDDYIRNPKPSGYRGVHLIFRYFSDKNKAMYNGMKIEMQLRSKYQHAWATAVETVGMFSGQALKSSLGSDDWKRFFSLMGSIIAFREKSPLIPNTPTARSELIYELRDYALRLQVDNRLREYGRALHAISNASSDAYFYLLQLNPTKGTLQVTGYKAAEAIEADRKYAEAEAAVKKNANGDAVLVSVDSVTALRKAYPNYFADTRLFVELMDQALTGRSKSIRLSEPKIEQGTLPF